MAMATLMIDGHEVVTEAGTGLVEAAAIAGIEIPVFCYEPRIGPPIGACRMCMVEIDGMPKMQTACTTTVRDGMVVSSSGKRARDAQEAVIEFLLINHPLDCPVCDKGGECPLQDQSYRWGRGSSRFTELKRNLDKPIPVSPLIALDRERCIFCFRCTRFSDEVAGDGQLVMRERGAANAIATFEGRPYTGHFSGNIIEVCPVGALTSTEYRFRARPWESRDHPTTCTSCAVGCNTYGTVREGKVQRVLARENTAVDEGWLCDRGRFAYPSLYGAGRIVAPRKVVDRNRPAGNAPRVDVSWEGALEQLHAHLVASQQAGQGATWVLSGSETLEIAWAVQQVAAATGGTVAAFEGGAAAGPRASHAATIADLPAARRVLVLGDADLVDDAPILDLRVRKVLRAEGAVLVAGIGGTRLEQAGAVAEYVEPGTLDAWVASHVGGVAGGEDAPPSIVLYRDGELTDESLAALVAAYGLERAGSGLLAVPKAANARGLSALGIEPIGFETLEAAAAGGLVLVGVDPSRAYAPNVWAPVLRKAAWLVCVDMFETPVHALTDLVIPATHWLEREGTSVSLEGRLQRLAPTGALPGELQSELKWLAGLARRVGQAGVPGYAAGAFRMLAEGTGDALPAKTYAEIPEAGVLGVTGRTVARAATPPSVDATGRELTVYVAPFLYDADEVANAPAMSFLNEATWVTLARSDADDRGLTRGDEVLVVMGETNVRAQVATSKRLRPGHARMTAGAPGVPSHLGGYRTATLEPIPTLAGSR